MILLRKAIGGATLAVGPATLTENLRKIQNTFV